MSLGIYVHIPFCQSRCNYCNFVSVPFEAATAGRYQKAVLSEMAFSTSVATEEVNSVYFGGGTPSLVSAEHIEGILAECRLRFCVSEDCEVSLEVNPETLTAEKAAALRKAGINRISIGAQSFADKELALIGRLHTSEMILESVDRLRKNGFANINLDLMLGVPCQTAESWRKNLETLAGLEIPHISVYMLDLDEQCPLHSMVRDGIISTPEDDLVSDLYLETIGCLSSLGYVQYEISNFAQPGYSCRHNLKYWMRDPVIGYGLGSHSFDRHLRYANCAQIDEYFRLIESGIKPIAWREAVAKVQALEEALFLGLRLTEGVNWSRLQSIYGSECLSQYEDSLRALSAQGLIDWQDTVVRLTASGMLLSNEIFQVFV